MALSTIFWGTLLLFLTTFSSVNGRMRSFQLPHQLVSRMSGEWGLEVSSPCSPLTASGTLKFFNGTINVEWLPEGSWGPQVEPGMGEATRLDASGLSVFMTGEAKAPVALAYTLCATRHNTMTTPDRPGLGKTMEITELKEMNGFFAKSEEELKECESKKPNVFIRTIGSDIQGLKEDHWRIKESLQYIEMQFDAVALTKHCVDKSEKTGTKRDSSVKDNKDGNGKKRRVSVNMGSNGAKESSMDQHVRDGAIMIRFMRRTLPTKSFFERYYVTILFGCLMVLYRAVYGFTSYRTQKK